MKFIINWSEIVGYTIPKYNQSKEILIFSKVNFKEVYNTSLI